MDLADEVLVAAGVARRMEVTDQADVPSDGRDQVCLP